LECRMHLIPEQGLSVVGPPANSNWGGFFLMQALKRDLAIGIVICGLTLMLVMAWGGPFTSSPYAQDQQQQPQTQQSQQQPDQNQKAGIFTGTIIKDGHQYALSDASGTIYKLDDSERAKPYEGKPVKVTGEFDGQANVIYVESIEPAKG